MLFSDPFIKGDSQSMDKFSYLPLRPFSTDEQCELLLELPRLSGPLRDTTNIFQTGLLFLIWTCPVMSSTSRHFDRLKTHPGDKSLGVTSGEALELVN